MVPAQPLAAELKLSSEEELLLLRSVAPRFSVQICLICISRETLLLDKEILNFPGGPSRHLFAFHLGVPWVVEPDWATGPVPFPEVAQLPQYCIFCGCPVVLVL